MRPKVFISYASEDKSVARPLARALADRGFDVWFDEFALSVGDPLLKTIDAGLSECDFGIVFLSERFFSKEWPQRELAGLAALEEQKGTTILPVWHEMTILEVARFSPILANRLAVTTNEDLSQIVDRLVLSMRRHAISDETLRYILPYAISGPQVVDIMKKAHFMENRGASEFALYLYSDASGLDEEASFIKYQSGARRVLTDEDVIRALDGLPSAPTGYSVRRWAPDSDRAFFLDKYSGGDEIAIDMNDVEVLHFDALLDDHFVSDAEVVRFLRELASFSDGLDLSTHRSFWDGADSPGRKLVRRTLETGRLAELTDLLIVDEHLSWSRPRRPVSDYRRFKLATDIVWELNRSNTQPPEVVVQALLGARSPINDYWKARLRAVLRGDPIWVDDEEQLQKFSTPKEDAPDSDEEPDAT